MKKLLLATLLAFVSCSTQKTESPKQLKRLNINFTHSPPTLDPRKGGDPVSSSLQFMLFEGLTKMTPESSTAPALAKEIKVSADCKTYTFILREAHWSNGDRVCALDFEKSWKTMLSPEFPAPNAHLLYPIRNAEVAKRGLVSLDDIGVRSINESTLVVELEQPTPYFLELTSFCALFPVNHRIAKHKPTWADELTEDFVSNGPFKLTRWRQDYELNLEKSPTYYNSKNIQLDEINISLVSDDMTVFQMFEKGDLDIIGGPFSDIPSDLIPSLNQENRLTKVPIAATTICNFNLARPPFNNTNIRRGLSIAINRKSIVKNITQLNEKIATGPIPPILKKRRSKRYFSDGDQTLAKAYFEQGLAETGFSKEDFEQVSLSYIGAMNRKRVAEAIQQQWKHTLGIEVKLEPVEFKVFLDKLVKRNYSMGIFEWIAQYNDPMNIFDRFKFKDNPKNYPGWENSTYSGLIDDSINYTDFEARMDMLDLAETLFVEEMPLTSLYHWNHIHLKQKYIKNFYVSPIGSIHLENICIEK